MEEGDGFVLVYQRQESESFQWPRNSGEAQQLTAQQCSLDWNPAINCSPGRSGSKNSLQKIGQNSV